MSNDLIIKYSSFSCKSPKKRKKRRAKSFSFNQSVLWCLWSNVITAQSGLSRLAILISSCADGNADNNCESCRPARAMREVNPVTLVRRRRVDVRPGLVHAVPQLVGCVCNLQCRRNVCSRIFNIYILASAVAEPVFFLSTNSSVSALILLLPLSPSTMGSSVFWMILRRKDSSL